MKSRLRYALLLIVLTATACSKAYYGGLEKLGIPKREVMVHRVEKARETQEETKQQFKSALEQFTVLTNFQGGDLESTYGKLNDEYEASVQKADEIHKRIADIEDVSEALFAEWEAELREYTNASLRQTSSKKLAVTKAQYRQLLTAMRKAESKLEPVLKVFKDQVLFLKHNLNAQAIASLKGQLDSVKSDVSALVLEMEKSINEADSFIATMEKS